MMADTPITNASLPAVLAARARAASDGRLALDVAGGLAAALGVAIWRPTAWQIVLGAAVGIAAFGTWGIAQREIDERTAAASAGHRIVVVLRALQGISIAAGILAAALAGFFVLSVGLRTLLN